MVKKTFNRALRGVKMRSPPLPRFEVKAEARGFHSSVDLARLNQLNDDLEIESFLRQSTLESDER